MKIGIAVWNEIQKQEILRKNIHWEATIQWVSSTIELLNVKDADFWIDCTFSGNEIVHFEKPTIVHSLINTLAQSTTGNSIGGFCAWPTFIERDIWEVSIAKGNNSSWVQELTRVLGQKFIIVKDEPGLVAPRIVCTVINEAYFALQAGISSAGEIDTAMKLGTNYPYGPIEWGGLIGLSNVYELLLALSKQNLLYTPAFTIN